jgi:hypothetical protein
MNVETMYTSQLGLERASWDTMNNENHNYRNLTYGLAQPHISLYIRIYFRYPKVVPAHLHLLL